MDIISSVLAIQPVKHVHMFDFKQKKDQVLRMIYSRFTLKLSRSGAFALQVLVNVDLHIVTVACSETDWVILQSSLINMDVHNLVISPML